MSIPPAPANIFVNTFLLLSFKFTPTLGCKSACPFFTIFLFPSNSGLFKICAIAPTNSKAVLSGNSVSASNVITYFIFGNISWFIVFILNLFLLCFNIYSLNCIKSPLFLSHPRYFSSELLNSLSLYKKWKIGNSVSFWYLSFNNCTCNKPSFITSLSNFSSFLSLSEQSPNNAKYIFFDLFAK